MTITAHQLSTQRFELKILTAIDASNDYLNWLNTDQSALYISYQASDLAALATYINTKYHDPNCYFWGIFDQQTHIGNLKYERMADHPTVATMGILIGVKHWQGKGVAPEVIKASMDYLKQQGITCINLGVNKNNIGAIKAYEKLGFTVAEQGYYQGFAETSVEMIYQL